MRIRERPDGRMYSRVLRRAVSIVASIPSSKSMQLDEIVELLLKRKLPEFYLMRFKRQISEARMRDYVRFVRDLGLMKEEAGGYSTRSLPHLKTAEEYAQVFSDLALEHLAKLIPTPPAQVPSALLKAADRLLESKRVPTIDSVAETLNIGSGRQRELFRWSLYIYADGEASKVEVYRYPIISRKAKGEI